MTHSGASTLEPDVRHALCKLLGRGRQLASAFPYNS